MIESCYMSFISSITAGKTTNFNKHIQIERKSFVSMIDNNHIIVLNIET